MLPSPLVARLGWPWITQRGESGATHAPYTYHFQGFMPKRRNSSADALEFRLFCIKSWMYTLAQAALACRHRGHTCTYRPFMHADPRGRTCTHTHTQAVHACKHHMHTHQGLYSLSNRMSSSQILWSLEAARLGLNIIASLWNLSGWSDNS